MLYLNLKESNYCQKEKGEEGKMVQMGQIRRNKILWHYLKIKIRKLIMNGKRLK